MTQRQSTIRYRIQLFHDACAIVEKTYACHRLLDHVARTLATSRRQIQRAFSEVGNISFRDYVTGVRMRRAAALLARPEGSTVRTVAAEVGYRQPAQFAKAFRRHHGLSPREFRASLATA
ncbi:MAG: helix-turn-helix transcriptional regulator [Actinomycetota bacterium]|nr:helix-turn-helix transcriptional regulator [Actinomycetota bacterium]